MRVSTTPEFWSMMLIPHENIYIHVKYKEAWNKVKLNEEYPPYLS